MHTKAVKIWQGLFLALMLCLTPLILPVQAYENYGGYDWAGFSGEVNYAHKHPEDTEYIATVKKQIWLYLVNDGYTEEAAAGVMGNIQAECGFDPTVTEGWVEWKDFPWWSTAAGGGLGMVGFTAAQYKTDLGKACVNNNVEWTCLDVQLQVGIKEVENAIVTAWHNDTFKKDPEAMKKSKSIRDVAVAVVMNYEICQGYNTQAVWDVRTGFGEKIYEELKGTKGDYDPANNPKQVGGDAKNKITNDKKEKDSIGPYGTFIEEWDLLGMPEKTSYIDTYEGQPQGMMTQKDLTLAEQNQAGLLKEAVINRKQFEQMALFRQIIMCIGIFLCLYSILLLLCGVLDTVNTLTDISMLHIVSFGRIKLSSGSLRNNEDLRKTAGMMCGLFTLGLGIISGSYFAKFMQLTTFLFDHLDQFLH